MEEDSSFANTSESAFYQMIYYTRWLLLHYFVLLFYKHSRAFDLCAAAWRARFLFL